MGAVGNHIHGGFIVPMLIEACQRRVKDRFSAIYFMRGIVHEGFNRSYLPGEYSMMKKRMSVKNKTIFIVMVRE
jgi:hypothetical protein